MAAATPSPNSASLAATRGRPRRARCARALALAAWLASGCSAEPMPNVVLIAIDTLRRDHTSVYGYERDTTPRLRRFAEQGVRFDQAYAPMSLTGPAFATLLTGQYPVTHRLIKNGPRLAGEHRTLAEILAARGYQTAAVVSSFVLKERFGFAQGFELFADEFEPQTASVGSVDAWEGHPVEGAFDRRAGATSEIALSWLAEGRDPGRPFFLLLHYFDPHTPYSPPGAFSALFDPEAVRGDRLQEAVRRYDAEIAFTDHEIGRVLDAVDRELAGQPTLVVITADHGEALEEHGYLGHGAHVFEEEVRVPLLSRWPGRIRGGRTLVEPVELVDLLPTILDLIGVAEGAAGLPGRSLGPALLGHGRLEASRPVFLHRGHYREGMLGGAVPVKGEKYAIVANRWKYIDGPEQGTRELYDLEHDPAERINRYYTAPDRAAELAARLAAWRKTYTTTGSEPEVAPEDRAGLEALGYTE